MLLYLVLHYFNYALVLFDVALSIVALFDVELCYIPLFDVVI